MTTTPLMTAATPLGDILEALEPEDLRVSPALGHHAIAAEQPHATLASGAPSNQQILDATKQFYSAHQTVVDATTVNAKSVAQTQPGYVNQLNGYNWNSQQLTQDEQNTTSSSIFGSNGTGGLWDNTLDNVKADQLFTTIGVGVSADVQFFIGGAGGLGCVWDIAKREGPKGYGYATGELGIRITAAFNVQCVIFNQLPSALNYDIFGLKVSLDLGLSLAFQVFWTNISSLQLLGYGIGVGVGIGGGATVFGGHIWNFG
jgi:hypothetical protein